MALNALHLAWAAVCAPLLIGVINRTKACFAGRDGQPLLQPYYDIGKLLSKGAVYSKTTTWVFKAGPAVSLGGALTALLLLPMGGCAAAAAFPGDFLLFAGALGLGRFCTIAAALDTGSAFEAMGASREAWYCALIEPALLLGLAALARLTGAPSLSGMYAGLGPENLIAPGGAALLLVAAAFLLVSLAENSRLPFDDPNTHLELTMIHEVMVLDHGGPDLGIIQYAAALKLWALGALTTGLFAPVDAGNAALSLLTGFLSMLLFAVAIGTIESVMARLKLARVPQVIAAAAALSILALMFIRTAP